MTSVRSSNTHIFTNRDGNTLIQEFEGVLHHNPQIKNLDAVVGFLRASGYFSLRPFLNALHRVRVLIGIDVDRYIVEADRQGKLFFGAGDAVRRDCLAQIRKDIESAHYRKEVEDGIFQMVEDLLVGKLELRAHPSKRIHAKLYVLYPDEFNQYTQGMVITGSSNLSGNGLGIGEERQYEFNVKITQHEDVQFAKDEFEELWEESHGCEITATALKESITLTYLRGDVTPYDLYVRMLMEYFSDRFLEVEKNESFSLPEGYTKYDYQMDAVVEGYRKLIRYDGFFLSDVVGLGKTVIATMIAKKFVIENGGEHTKILVVYPPAVEENWKRTFKDFGIDLYSRFISNGSLAKVLDKAYEYDLVVVDEAHKFRNHSTASFDLLQKICKRPRLKPGNVSGYRKKVILISATPMNNTPEDLRNEISLFQDLRRCSIDGVSNLTAFFTPVIEKFRDLRKDPNASIEEFRKLTEEVRERIIKPLTVRRTRTDIESIPRYQQDVKGFPKVEQPIAKRYILNDRLASLFEATMQTLDTSLTYARYQAIAHLKKNVANGLYDNAALVSHSLSGIRKNGLVKRLESSFYAFRVSIQRFRQANQNMLDMFARGRVFIAPDLDVNLLLEKGLSEDEIEEKLNAKAESNPKNAVFKASDFLPEFVEKLRADQALLEKMCTEWEKITEAEDSKFATFQALLKDELFKKECNLEQKLVVFSESEDTIAYLARRIKAELHRSDVLAIWSSNLGQHFHTICENFDANYKEKRNDYNIILTTDVLAEGVNLHRSNVILNYDTPWNSTRLMQRIGRVNRIGSKSKHIYNYVFYPSREGDKVLNLYQIALSKIQTFHFVLGEDNRIYSESEIIDESLSRLFDKALTEQRENLNQELLYYEELRTLYENAPEEYKRIARLSLRSRTGRGARTVDGVSLSGDTLVFLKTNFRKVFFLVGQQARELSVLEALKYFKASPEEKSTERSSTHHLQVEKALEAFHASRVTEIQEQETAREVRGNRGAQLMTALSLLTNCMRAISDNDLRLKVLQLKTLAERGVITHIARRLERIQKDLRRKKVVQEEAWEEILEMATEYAPYYLAEEALCNEKESGAEIILSESFA